MIVRCLAILALLLVVGASCSGGAEPTVDLGAIGRLNASATKLTASRIFNIAVWIDKEAARGLSYPTSQGMEDLRNAAWVPGPLKSIAVDAWCNPIWYWSNGRDFLLISHGTDGRAAHDYSAMDLATVGSKAEFCVGTRCPGWAAPRAARAPGGFPAPPRTRTPRTCARSFTEFGTGSGNNESWHVAMDAYCYLKCHDGNGVQAMTHERDGGPPVGAVSLGTHLTSDAPPDAIMDSDITTNAGAAPHFAPCVSCHNPHGSINTDVRGIGLSGATNHMLMYDWYRHSVAPSATSRAMLKRRGFGRPAGRVSRGGRGVSRTKSFAAIGASLAWAALLVLLAPGTSAGHTTYFFSSGYGCSPCHNLAQDPEFGWETNTSWILRNSRTLNTMKGLNGNQPPATFGCTYCHNDPFSTAGMKDALADFATQTSMHFVGLTRSRVPTWNEYVSNWTGGALVTAPVPPNPPPQDELSLGIRGLA